MIRRCPQCGSTTDDKYGFCYKCGRELPKMEVNENMCPLCKHENPDEAEYCVKCGTPLIFKQNMGNDPSKPIMIKKEIKLDNENYHENTTSSWLIIFGYVFSILGGIIGLIIAIYLSTRKDPVARRHGHIQLVIFLVYALILVIFIVTGHMTMDMMTEQYREMLSGNFTMFQR